MIRIPITEEEKQKLLYKRHINYYESILNRFTTIDPYKSIDDIPEIPIVDPYMYNMIIIPGLIMNGAIPKHELIIGREYEGTCRNASKAKWLGDKFVYERRDYLVGDSYPEKINHFEDDDGFDVFVPIKLIT